MKRGKPILGLTFTLLAAVILLLPAPAGAGYELVGKWQTVDATWIGGITTDSQDNVYVVDPNFRTDYPCPSERCPPSDFGLIEKYDSDGNMVTSWLPDPGSMSWWVAAVATDSKDNVYYPTGRQIAKSDSDGGFLAAWGSGVGEFFRPSGLALDSQDNVYVVDRGNASNTANRIEKFDSSGNFLTKWGSHGSGNGQFLSSPGPIATDSKDNVYVYDGGPSEDGPVNRIQKFDSDGNFVTQWGSQGGAEGRFAYVEGIATDSEDNIHVVDNMGGAFVVEARIQTFTSAGEFLGSWSSNQFKHPRGIAFDSEDNLYVADSWPPRILKFAYVDRELAGSATAKGMQIKKGGDIRVRVKITAQEAISAEASGRIKVNPTYKLKPETMQVAGATSKTMQLVPKKKHGKKIAKALKKGKKAKAKLTVKMTDDLGNKKSQKLSVKLKR